MDNKINRKINKNKLNRTLTKQHELKKLPLHFLKRLLNNHNYITNLYYFQKYKKESSISLIKNICIFTARYRGVLSFYKLSRLKLKEFGNMGLIPGLRKSSW